MRGIVGTRIHATRFFVIQTKIARCGFHLHAGDGSSRMQQIVDLDRERMHVDVSVRTVVGALAATNAPILDDYLERIAAANRSHGATYHA